MSRGIEGGWSLEKNALGGGHMPNQHVAVHAAWFRLALIAYNLPSAIKGM